MADGAAAAPRAAPPEPIAADPIRDADAAGDHAGPDDRAALDEGPDRGALRRPGLHGEAAAPPGEARLTQKLLDCGFSPALIRKLAAGLTADVGRRDRLGGRRPGAQPAAPASASRAIEDQGGVFALVGATGVGKTTTTAKIAAAFATQHGAANLGLITLDAYRVGAHEQLRAYGRILGVPVHTAHDRASLEDLLELLAAKKMVLIDTAGMAQRDSRTRELLDMLVAPLDPEAAGRQRRLAGRDDRGRAGRLPAPPAAPASCCRRSTRRSSSARRSTPLIRHKLKVVGVANGQRVPEDWHRLSASALVQRALRGGGSSAYRLDAERHEPGLRRAAHGSRPNRAARCGA